MARFTSHRPAHAAARTGARRARHAPASRAQSRARDAVPRRGTAPATVTNLRTIKVYFVDPRSLSVWPSRLLRNGGNAATTRQVGEATDYCTLPRAGPVPVFATNTQGHRGGCQSCFCTRLTIGWCLYQTRA